MEALRSRRAESWPVREWVWKGNGLGAGARELTDTSKFGPRTVLPVNFSAIPRNHLLSIVSAQFYVWCCAVHIRMTWSWSLINLRSKAILLVNILRMSHFIQRKKRQASRPANWKGTKPLPLLSQVLKALLWQSFNATSPSPCPLALDTEDVVKRLMWLRTLLHLGPLRSL